VNRPIDILGLGCVAVDELLYVDRYPSADAKTQVLRRERQCGGLTATALVAGARLGARCAYAGALGEDDLSRFVLERFSRQGVETGWLVRDSAARPVASTIVVDSQRGTRNIFYDLAGSLGASPAGPPEDAIRSCRVLLVDHFGVEGMIRAARIAREAGIPVVADFERDNLPGFDELLGLVDHLVLSHGFASRRTGENDPERILRSLSEPPRAVVAVTCGDQGCYYRAEGGPIGHMPAFTVEVVDTTGCGDVFHGAYAAALARGLGLRERVRFASAASALKAMRSGGQAGIPDLSVVEAFLDQADVDERDDGL